MPALSTNFVEVVAGLPQALMAMADAATGSVPLDFADAATLVRTQHESIAARFRAHLAEAWQAVEGGHPLSVEGRFADDGLEDLSLVSPQELEARLAARNLAAAVLQEWKPELRRLDQYLGWIAGNLRIDADTNPFGPQHLGAAVHEAFAPCVLMPAARLAIIRRCESELVARTGQLYATLEQRLADIARTSRQARPRAKRLARIPRAGDPARAEATAQSDWISRFFLQWDAAAATPTGSGGAQARSGATVLPAPLHALLQRSRASRPEAGRPPAGVADTRRVLGHRELMSVLALMQTVARDVVGDAAAGSLAGRLKSELGATAARLGIDREATRMDPSDEDTLELVAMLFEVLLDECHLEGGQRELIASLLLPYAKVALLDPSVFIDEWHPARRLLNMLADTCEGNPGETGPEKQQLQRVEAAVERVLNAYDEDIGIIRDLHEDFGLFYEQQRRRIEIAERRTAETQRAQERLENAKVRAAWELASRLEGRALPPAIERFVQDDWVRHVTLLLVRGEDDGEPMRDARLLLERLAQAIDQAREGGVGRTTLLALQPLVQKCLLALGLGDADAAARMNALRDALMDLADAWIPPPPEAIAHHADDDDHSLGHAGDHLGASLGGVGTAGMGLDASVPSRAAAPAGPAQELPLAAPIPAAVAIPGSISANDAPGFDFDQVTAGYFRGLSVGTWLDFVDKDGKVQPGKLTWISPISQRLLFVNRRGGRFMVAAAEELALMVRMDRVRLHRDEDAFYSAMQGAIDQLEPDIAVTG